MPNLYIIAACNGAGKTTAEQQLLKLHKNKEMGFDNIIKFDLGQKLKYI